MSLFDWEDYKLTTHKLLIYAGCSKYCPEWCLVTNRGAGHKVCIVMLEALYPFVYKLELNLLISSVHLKQRIFSMFFIVNASS